MAFLIRTSILLGLGLQHAVLAEDDCTAAFKRGKEVCEAVIKKGEDLCKDSDCQGAVNHAAAICTAGTYYWDAEEQEEVDITKELSELQAACNDPCMSQVMACMVKGDNGKDTFSCSEECQGWYANLGECKDKEMPDDDGTARTFEEMFSQMEWVCDDCLSGFSKFSDSTSMNCFEEPCNTGCSELLGELYTQCAPDKQIQDPATSQWHNIHEMLEDPKAKMDACGGGNSDDCIAAFKRGKEVCEAAMMNGANACEDAGCLGAVDNAASLCTDPGTTYWDAEEQDEVNVAKELGEIQAACSDPCMSKMIGCTYLSGDESEMSCRDECQRWYADSGECKDRHMPGSTLTYGQLFGAMELMCDPCRGPFVKFIEMRCFDDPCGAGCMEMITEVYGKCGDHEEFTDPTSSGKTFNIHAALLEPRRAMGSCGGQCHRIPKAIAEHWGAKVCHH